MNDDDSGNGINAKPI